MTDTEYWQTQFLNAVHENTLLDDTERYNAVFLFSNSEVLATLGNNTSGYTNEFLTLLPKISLIVEKYNLDTIYDAFNMTLELIKLFEQHDFIRNQFFKATTRLGNGVTIGEYNVILTKLIEGL